MANQSLGKIYGGMQHALFHFSPSGKDILLYMRWLVLLTACIRSFFLRFVDCVQVIGLHLFRQELEHLLQSSEAQRANRSGVDREFDHISPFFGSIKILLGARCPSVFCFVNQVYWTIF